MVSGLPTSTSATARRRPRTPRTTLHVRLSQQLLDTQTGALLVLPRSASTHGSSVREREACGHRKRCGSKSRVSQRCGSRHHWCHGTRRVIGTAHVRSRTDQQVGQCRAPSLHGARIRDGCTARRHAQERLLLVYALAVVTGYCGHGAWQCGSIVPGRLLLLDRGFCHVSHLRCGSLSLSASIHKPCRKAQQIYTNRFFYGNNSNGAPGFRSYFASTL